MEEKSAEPELTAKGDSYQLERTVWLERGIGVNVIIKIEDTPEKTVRDKRQVAQKMFRRIKRLLKHIHEGG